MEKSLLLVLVSFLLTFACILPMANAQIIRSYEGGHFGTNSDLNYCAFTIAFYSPNDQTAYVDTIPLKFNITWTTYPTFPFPDVPPALNGYYAYSIDEGPFVEIMSNQSANDNFYHRPANDFIINPSFSYSVNISHLEKGYHNIVINASLYHSTVYPPDHLYFNITTSPYTFLVGKPTATPTPTAPEFTTIAIVPLFAATLFIAVKLSQKKQ